MRADRSHDVTNRSRVRSRHGDWLQSSHYRSAPLSRFNAPRASVRHEVVSCAAPGLIHRSLRHRHVWPTLPAETEQTFPGCRSCRHRCWPLCLDTTQRFRKPHRHHLSQKVDVVSSIACDLALSHSAEDRGCVTDDCECVVMPLSTMVVSRHGHGETQPRPFLPTAVPTAW